MSNPLKGQLSSVQSIRRRLIGLLWRTFGAVVVLTFFAEITLIGYVVNSTSTRWNPFYSTPIAALLETYYLAHGSWDGVESIFEQGGISGRMEVISGWQDSFLLDLDGRVVFIPLKMDNPPQIGSTYVLQEKDVYFPLSNHGQEIGGVVVRLSSLSHPRRLMLALLTPVAFIAGFLALLTLLFAWILTRRMINPLAEVIAGAQSVAEGRLSTRISLGTRHDDLSALGNHFNHMAEELERAELERRNLLADIAHELRTPLTILRGKLEGILDGIYPADDAHIAPVLEQTYLLERLVDDLRLLTLAETRELHLDPRPVELNELVRMCTEYFRATSTEKGVHLVVEEDEAEVYVRADAQRVAQVCGNLISNALRYTPPEGRITVTVRRNEVSVRDSGPGVAEEDLDHIFDRFWRAEKSRARSEGGAGLGLAITRRLVEAQGGTIRARNVPGGGLEVSFSLPANEQA